ncbi:MAG: hypothetical protein SGBAC_001400 [Bacillariaceae sp.]
MTTKRSVSISTSLRILSLLVVSATGFSPTTFPLSTQNRFFALDAEAIPDTSEEASLLIEKLRQIADQTNRGFQASSTQRRQARDIALSLEKLNATPAPAAAYYESNNESKAEGPTVSGKWNLIFTDAPDITSLDTSRNPFSTATLGRIGQECNPPFVKNVIEWKRPSWAGSLPFSGSEDSRILQKVVTSASASPEKPDVVDLKIAGLELENPNRDDQLSTVGDIASRIERDGLVAGLLSSNPIDLKGPLNPPFGQFRILYLDDDLRITLTSQNYIAVNSRCKEGEEWF